MESFMPSNSLNEGGGVVLPPPSYTLPSSLRKVGALVAQIWPNLRCPGKEGRRSSFPQAEERRGAGRELGQMSMVPCSDDRPPRMRRLKFNFPDLVLHNGDKYAETLR